MPLSTQPPRGTSDWLPSEFKTRKYIQDTWRKVCVRFGYSEYLTPIVERAEIYKAKSGEDIGGKELLSFRDKVERELSIRPEMTPSVTRMLAKIYSTAQKPIRLFSIANFWRNEKPQRGRNREFWQLNFDCFGSESTKADIEIIQIAIEIMLEFGAPQKSFAVAINSRKLIDEILDNVIKVNQKKKISIIRLMDKWFKLDKKELTKQLKSNNLNNSQIQDLEKFMTSESIDDLIANFPAIENSTGLCEIKEVFGVLGKLGYKNYIEFKPNVIRGFDYYNGIVFEVFDKNPKNLNRSLFGGGRYDGLGQIFGIKNMLATGCAPGDETMKLFLQYWGLLDKIKKDENETYYLPVLEDSLEGDVLKLAKKIRKNGSIVEIGLTTQKINKALNYADKKKINKVIILGPDEAKKKIYKIKDMKSGKEKNVKF